VPNFLIHKLQKRQKIKGQRQKDKDKRTKTKGSRHYEKQSKKSTLRKNIENNWQLVDFYLFTFVFYLLHE
jgi:hypothetical protein